MSSREYQQYGGNPYGSAEEGYGQANPYGGQTNPYGDTAGTAGTAGTTGTTGTAGYATANPYQNDQPLNPPAPVYQGTAHDSPASQYSAPSGPPPQHGSAPLSQQDFLSRIDGTKSRIHQLTSSIQEIASVHQRLLGSPDSVASHQLESLVADTQLRNTQIKDEIKFLERDAGREPSNTFKRTQVESLKRTFKTQLDDYYKEESDYSKRYRDAIARQYRIVNPDATEDEVSEAANADWGQEGIFQQALKSNRSGQASSVLGAVRARHNDIQRIEKTMVDLSLLFQQLDEQVVFQEPLVQRAEEQTVQVVDDTKNANTQLGRGIISARRARKLKWYCLLVCILIVCILALILGLWFGIGPPSKNNDDNGNQN